MARGDHIKVGRGIYSHHGIDLGDGRVIHYSGELGRKRNASVRVDSMGTFLDGGVPTVVSAAHPGTGDVIVARACRRVGERDYGLFTNNCEHFATSATEGIGSSGQVRKGLMAVGALFGIAIVVLRGR